MKRSIFAIAALAAVTFANAAPVTVTIDNFNSPNVGPLTAALAATSTAMDAVRTTSITTLAGPADGNGASVKIGAGTFPVGLLEVANASGRDSQVELTWTVAAGLLPLNALNLSFFLEIVQSDGNLTDLAFFLNGAPLASFAIPGNTTNSIKTFTLTNAQAVAMSGGGVLSLKVNGDAGWDLTVDQLGFKYDMPSVVSEPASLALAGMALAGVLAASRRRKA